MTETIVIRFTKTDKEYLSKLASKHRLTLSSFLRSELLNLLTFLLSCALFGGLAQLARALAWQARGQRFESAILHFKKQA